MCRLQSLRTQSAAESIAASDDMSRCKRRSSTALGWCTVGLLEQQFFRGQTIPAGRSTNQRERKLLVQPLSPR